MQTLEFAEQEQCFWGCLRDRKCVSSTHAQRVTVDPPPQKTHTNTHTHSLLTDVYVEQPVAVAPADANIEGL